MIPKDVCFCHEGIGLRKIIAYQAKRDGNEMAKEDYVVLQQKGMELNDFQAQLLSKTRRQRHFS
jgi:hypothetical protein